MAILLDKFLKQVDQYIGIMEKKGKPLEGISMTPDQFETYNEVYPNTDGTYMGYPIFVIKHNDDKNPAL